MDKITSILSTEKRPLYSRKAGYSKRFCSKNLCSNEQLFLPAISMMTLKHRDTNQRHHGNQRYYGNKYVDSIDSRNSDNRRNHGNGFQNNRLLSNIKCESDEREIVVKYRLEKEKETENISKILITKQKRTHLRTVSRRRAELASRELGERLIKRGVTLPPPPPPPITNCLPKQERESQSFNPSVVHQRYKSLSENKSKCCESVEAAGGKTQEGKQPKRYVHIYLCCCKE